MTRLEDAIKNAKGGAQTVGEMLREIGKISTQAAELLEQDLANADMGLAKCYAALEAYARKHASGSKWVCGGFDLSPDNEAVKVILDFYHIPHEWISNPQPAAEPAPLGNVISVDFESFL